MNVNSWKLGFPISLIDPALCGATATADRWAVIWRQSLFGQLRPLTPLLHCGRSLGSTTQLPPLDRRYQYSAPERQLCSDSGQSPWLDVLQHHVNTGRSSSLFSRLQPLTN
jgi:hypothetical protein